MATGYFRGELFEFLGELAENNNRDWFTANKPRYENAVQAPAVHFVEEIGPQLATFSRAVTADPRPFGGSISRIYRDTRFSRDKSPYKTNVGIHFAHARAKTSKENLPGFYLHLASGDSMVASGIWRPAPPHLAQIRSAIVRNPSDWARALAGGLSIGGESSTRLPAGLPPDHPYAEDLKRKDFFASLPLTNAQVTSASFGATFLAACRKLNPLNRFLATAIDVPW